MQPSHEAIASPETPDTALSEAERRAAVEALVAQLPDKLRLPLQLHYLNGMTQREVAATLGVPPSTIDSRLKTALERLRPLADRAGLRDVLGMLAAGGMSAGLMAAPVRLTAASALGASVAPSVATGFLGTVTAKIVAVAAIIAVVVGIGVFWTTEPERDALVEGTNALGKVDRVDAGSTSARVSTVSVPDEEDAKTRLTKPVEPAISETAIESTESAALLEEAETVESTVAEATDQTPVPPTHFMSVIVVDKETGKPVSDARTQVRATNYNKERTTSPDGVARYDDVPLTRATVVAQADGLARDGLYMEVGSADPVVTLELGRGAILHGRVTLPDGEPARNQPVAVKNNALVTLGTTTDDEGYYEIAHVARGFYLAGVSAGLTPVESSWFSESKLFVPIDAERFEHNMVYSPKPRVERRLSGWVMDARTGQPIAGAGLRGGFNYWSEQLARTNEVGEFHIENVVAVSDQILVQAKGYAPKSILLTQIMADSIRVELEPGLAVAGYVVDEDENPIAGARVSASGGGSWHSIGEVYTDENGKFRIEDLDAGAVLDVFVSGMGQVAHVRDVAGKTNERILIERRFPATSKVIDVETGEPIRQYHVRFTTPKSMLNPPSGLETVMTASGLLIDSEDGVFALGQFKAGTLIAFTVSAEGYRMREFDPFKIAVETEPIALERYIDPPRSWKGIVASEDGFAISNAQIILIAHREGETELDIEIDREYLMRLTRGGHRVYETSTASDGTFDFGNVELPHGGTLAAQHDGHIMSTLRVDEESSESLEIAMRPGASVRVEFDRTIYREATAVEFTSRDGGKSFHTALEATSSHLEIGDLPPGQYTIRILTLGIPRNNGVAILRPHIGKTVEFDAGRQTLMKFKKTDGFTIAGRVVDGEHPWTEGGTLTLEMLQEDIYSRTSRPDTYLSSHEVPVAPDGTFSINNLDAGTYRVKFREGGTTPFELRESLTDLIVQRQTATLIGAIADWKPEGAERIDCILHRLTDDGSLIAWQLPVEVLGNGSFRAFC